MSDELSVTLPVESEGQRIGRLSVKAFRALVPDDWAPEELAQHDFGYDYQIQVIRDALAKDVFRAQLKGTTVPSLSEDGSFYSVELSVSTLNYLARATEPVLLVLCVLADTVLDSQLFHIWIDVDLKRIRANGVGVNQKDITIRIPSSNRLDKHTDLSREIARFRQLARVGNELDLVVQASRPSLSDEARAGLVEKIPVGLANRSPALLEAIAESPTSSWVDAKEGTPQWYLREASTAIRAGRTDFADSALTKVACVLPTLSSIEQADYWYQFGRLKSSLGVASEARDSLAKACSLSGDAPRHLAAWAESELRLAFVSDKDYSLPRVLERLTGNHPSVVAIRARVLSAEGRHTEAIEVAESVDGAERASTLAIVLLASAQPERAIEVCDANLSVADVLDVHRQVLLMIRARAKFALAVGGIPEGEVPLSGPAGANPLLLREVWQDISVLVREFRASNWPLNVEMISDIWGLTAAMLGQQASTLPILAEAASARPETALIQEVLEGMAAHEGELMRALEANRRQAPTTKTLLRQIVLLHALRRDADCVALMEREHPQIELSNLRYPFALSMAALSAERLFRNDLAAQWNQELDSRDAWRAEGALLRYFRSTSQNLLARDAALIELEAAYHRLDHPSSIANQLFYELDASDSEQATRCLDLGKEIATQRLLDMDACLHLGQALATLGQWDQLLQFVDDQIQRFTSNDRLLAVRALALDKLGLTNEAHRVLEALIDKEAPDPLALNTYIVINSRLGFNDRAIVCLEKVLSTATSKEAKLRCLRALFSIEQIKDPKGPRLLELAIGMGNLVDQNDEAEEGLYLILMLSATITREQSEGDSRISGFQERLKAFCARFPNSTVLKHATFSDDATGEDVLRSIRDLIGLSDEQLKQRLKTQNLLRRGQVAVPYAWRPRVVLDGIPDLPTLWELGKASKSDELHLHLQMVGTEWEAIPTSLIGSHTPLIDLTALLVLQDLDLLESLFLFFKKLAISKDTLQTIQRFLTPMSASPFREKCASLQDILKQHFEQIEQPGVSLSEEGGDEKVSNTPHDDVIAIARRGSYRLYSDDVLFRLVADLPETCPKPICTLDLLVALDESELLSVEEVAKRFAMLCAWRVFIKIPIRYEVAVLPSELVTAKTISARIDILRHDPLASAMFDALWTIEKPFTDLQNDGGRLIRDLVCEKNSDINSVAAIASWWVMKVKFHRDAPKLEFLRAVIIIQAIGAASIDSNIALRMWHVYHAIVEHDYGERMDDERYRASISELAELAAVIDYQARLTDGGSIRQKLMLGLTDGTSDSDLFQAAYAQKKIALSGSTSSGASGAR